MSDSYQATYDAVRSKISGCNIGDAVTEAVRLEISGVGQNAMSSISQLVSDMSRPSIAYKPSISIDGNQWCALYGENLQDGVAGFGDSPALAMEAFDREWFAKLQK